MTTTDSKTRISKLLSIADDEASTPAEIQMAVKKATQLMMSCGLTRHSLNKEGQTDELIFEEVRVGSLTNRRVLWEVHLVLLMEELFLGTSHYTQRYYGSSWNTRTGRAVNIGHDYVFYGAVPEVEATADTFIFLRQHIKDSAVRLWGGWARNNGATYAQAFVRSLFEVVEEVGPQSSEKEGAAQIEASRELRKAARQWVESRIGKLREGRPTPIGSLGSYNAEVAGRTDGSAHQIRKENGHRKLACTSS